ncbi:ASCH domain-containing protein (plasmid) [Photobacterium sp. CCB-ST2H9]|uniref:ASCH domain-containing protein n=1 Tax=Photobacterium sp. CCB-ST2H9 TaxID=2912855 RepID=UPI002004CED2|nr:ASCH domain-containing protein [Photobacterium sp. CCB-ST2H9]UTM60444.1 ASCH domain-containing protein [Photobacterium sp. CCB-ST2H9]
MSQKTLYLPLKRQYFEEIKSGEKTEEYREVTSYWKARLVNREYDVVHFMLGYPPAADKEKRIIRRYNGYTRKVIQHPHFGDAPTEVFAIKVEAE